jgi:hypothetical protein
VLIGFDQFEEEVEVVIFDVGVDQFFALSIHDADVHLACVKVDSAIELSGRSVILHMCNTSWLMDALSRPLIVIYAGSVDRTPRPLRPWYQINKRA